MSIPLFLMMYSKAWVMRPPLHPWFPSAVLQSTRFCSERDTRLPVARKCCPSTDPVVEKDQHEPHCPWFLMGVTAPLVRQSTVVGRAETSNSTWAVLASAE